MNRLNNKILTLLLFFLFLFAIIPSTNVIASSTKKCGDNLEWELSGFAYGSDICILKISGSGDMYNYDIGSVPWRNKKIKQVIMTGNITSISDYAFFECVYLEKIELPSSITVIGEKAFYGCSRLGGINLPEDLTLIGDFAFDGCSKLRTVSLPEGLTSIGEATFRKTDIANISIPNNVVYIGDYAFYGCSNLNIVSLSERLTSIGDYAFYECSNLSVDNLPDGLTSIGSHAFSGCSNLNVDSLPEGLTSIEDSAFSGCSNLNVDSLPEGLTSIGSYAFYKCSNLNVDSLPEGLTSIGSYAFYECSNLNVDSLPEGLTSIGSYAFSRTKITNITIPNTITLINLGMFNNCTSLESIVIPDGVSSIGNYAFDHCSNLKSIILPDSLTSIGSYAFRGCAELDNVILPNNLSTVGDHAFIGCIKLTSIAFPDSITSIGSHAFSNCYDLVSVTLPDHYVELGEWAILTPNTADVVLNSEVDCSRHISSSNRFHYYYDVTFITEENGTVNGKSRTYGTDRFTITPDDGYQVDEVIWNNELDTVKLTVDANNTCIMPDSDTEAIVNISFKKEYSVTVKDVIGVKVSVSKNIAFSGDEIAISIIPDTGYIVENIKVNGNVITGLEFEMPDSDVLIDVEFAKIDYSIDVILYGRGMAIVSKTIANYGDEIEITITPDSGYEIKTIKINGEETFDTIFDMPAEDVTVEISFKVDSPFACGDDLLWRIEDNTLIVSGTGDMYDYDSSESPWSKEKFTSVVISDGVTSIGNCAFRNCTKIESVSISDSVDSIGYRAFQGCDKLKCVNIPNGIDLIEFGTFNCCLSIESIDIPDTVTNIGDCAFSGCHNLTDIVIPDSVRVIGYGAFENCIHLSSIVIPDGVRVIEHETFDNCINLTHVIIPDSVNTIDYYAFKDCNSLESVVLDRDAYSEVAFPNISSEIFHYYYEVDYISNGNGTISGKIKTYGTEVLELLISPNDNYTLNSVIFTTDSNEIELFPDADGKCIMPDSDSSATLTVSFKIIKYSVSISTSVGGTAVLSQEAAAYGDIVSVNVTPDIGYKLEVIKVDGNIVNGETFMMPAKDITVKVEFKAIDYSVIASGTEHGSFAVDHNIANYGDAIIVNVYPNDGYELDHVMINGVVIEGTDFIMPAEDAVVEVIFRRILYNVCVRESEYGTTKVNTEKASIGDQIIISAVPNEGYELVSIAVNGNVISDLKFSMPASDIEIEAAYKKKDYVVTIGNTTNGTVVVSKTTANMNDVITITATPAEGYEIDTVKVNGTAIEGTFFNMPAEDVTVEVIFKETFVDKNGWIEEDGNWYFFDNGNVVTGWKSSGDKWYYLNPETGVMMTSWLNLDGTWYYLNNSGAMVTGWQSIGGKWYFFNTSGAMFSGWKQSSGSWYYLDPESGAMVIGWKQCDGKWYYFKNSGAMAANEYCDGYWLNSNGSWTYQYRATWRGNYSSGWWYGDDTGWYAKDETIKIDGKDYCFNASGYCTNP